MISEHPSPARILVVEDNSADVFLLRHALDAHAELYILDVLHDGAEALDFVDGQRAAGARAEPCVIVLDLHLPKHNGAAVLKAIREEPVLAHIDVMALTTLASPLEEQEVRELGVRLYRAKPVQIEEWIKLAGEILEICREHSRVMA
ncbi:MAG TPA: response regulator [Bryobacteraceae bacterium]|nr:response regulator [Bryobacteraceae bacterium]